jgi:Flp pilus assembly protein CpaB
MRRGRIFILLALILILILVAVFVFMQSGGLLPGRQQPVTALDTPVPTPVLTCDVVIATQSVARGQTLSEAVLGLVPYDCPNVQPGMMFNIFDAAGQRTRINLEPGRVLEENMLFSATDVSGSDAALMIEPGMVAVSIPIDRMSSVSYAPQRGDRVNVIVTLLFVELDTEFQSRLPNLSAQVLGPVQDETQNILSSQVVGGQGSPYIGRGILDPVLDSTFYALPSESQRPRLVSQTLIQDVLVLQTGLFPQPAEETGPAAQPTPVPADVPPPAAPGAETTTVSVVYPGEITLVVTPQDAITLVYLLNNEYGAHLTLALRGADDRSTAQTEAVTLQFLLDQYNIPIPVKLPYGVEPRVDGLGGYEPPPPPAPAATPEE